MILSALVSGYLLSLGLIMAIGAQNAFVLRQGLRGQHVFMVVLTCALSDAILISAGVAGFGALMQQVDWIGPVMRYGGAAFLVVYGLRSLRAAFGPPQHLDAATGASSGLWPTLLTCLAITWLNPHVYLDTMALIGTISTGYGELAVWFGAGAVAASFCFFFALGYGAALLRPLFAQPRAWRILDGFVAIVMFAIALSLIMSGH